MTATSETRRVAPESHRWSPGDLSNYYRQEA